MATNFPANPIQGQTYTNGYKTWSYTGVFWQAVLTSGSSAGSTTYDFDDISYYINGYNNTFQLSYNQSNVAITSTSSLIVAVNGILQRSFSYNVDTVWMSGVLFANKGYTVVTSNTAVTNTAISSGVLKFAEAPPINADVYIRYIGGTPNTTTKIYPFTPVDIVMGF